MCSILNIATKLQNIRSIRMTLKSKRNITSMAAGVATAVGYIIYGLSNAAPNTDDLKAWAIVMLVSIGIAVGVQIVTQIAFHIVASVGIAVKEKEKDGKTVERIIKSELKEDERDKRITLKASHIGYSCVGIGFIAGLIALACGAIALTALHIFLGACFAAAFVDGVMSVFLYEKGNRGEDCK